MAHGIVDFAMSNIHVLEQGAMYVGSDDLDFTPEQRGVMFHKLSERQADRMNTLDNFLMNAQGIKHNNSFYNSIRHGTSVGLEIGSLALSAYSLGKGIGHLARGSSSLARIGLSSLKVSEHTIMNLEGILNWKNFKSFSRRNCRYNLSELTGIHPSNTIEAHHVFPQKYKDIFFDKGINIHDPKYLTWWEKNPHRSTAKSYNDAWFEFIRKNPDASSVQILKKGKQLMTTHGIEVHY